MTFIITKLSDSHDVSDFSCGDRDINHFLIRDALRDQNRKHSVTYVMIEEGGNKVIAYVTVAMCSMSIEDIPKKITIADYPYQNTSALLIARLGRDINYRGKKLGLLMLKFAISEADRLSEEVGCRFVFLHSYTDKIEFYKTMEFEECEEERPEIDGDRRIVPMCLDLLG
jgi:predicted N-acetyltransferase YhbS